MVAGVESGMGSVERSSACEGVLSPGKTALSSRAES